MKEILRILGMMVAMLFMVGFGLCGAFGLVMGVATGGDGIAGTAIVMGLIGVVIAAVFALLFRWLLKLGKPPEDKP